MSQRTGSISYLTFARRLLPGGLRPLRARLRPGPASEAGSSAFSASECTGGLHHPPHGGRRREAYVPNDAPALVPRRRVRPLFRHLHAVQPIPGEAPDLPEALTCESREAVITVSSSSSGPSSRIASAWRTSWAASPRAIRAAIPRETGRGPSVPGGPAELLDQDLRQLQPDRG